MKGSPAECFCASECIGAKRGGLVVNVAELKKGRCNIAPGFIAAMAGLNTLHKMLQNRAE
jgi:hypothetical protein